MNFLQQTKLTEEEWKQLEEPIQNEKEILILNMIQNGYSDNNVNYQTHMTLNHYLKLDKKFDHEIFDGLLKGILRSYNKKNVLDIDGILRKQLKKVKMSSSEKIKLENSFNLLKDGLNDNIVEYKMLYEIKKFSKLLYKGKSVQNDKKALLHFVNIFVLHCVFKEELNTRLLEVVGKVICEQLSNVNSQMVMKHISLLYEHNQIFDYNTLELYQHQKDIFNIFRQDRNEPKFVFYCAPTSSGKTLTPIALSQDYKVIFICASKHIGLSLAKSSFHMKRKIGFAFGCTSQENIRLNYNAVHSYTTTKSGRKIPNHTDGTNVELMICDVLSYESAMNYMKQYNATNNIILFWDEPTIGLDVRESNLHDIIKKNWQINEIPNIVFSCATLPKEHQISTVIERAKDKFKGLQFSYIESVDQISNIRLYDIDGNVIIPHDHFDDYEKLCTFLNYHGTKYYKFFDCNECAKFLLFIDKEFSYDCVQSNFSLLEDISTYKIKEVYVSILLEIGNDKWNKIKGLYQEKKTKTNRDNKEHVGIDLTTKHSCTVTNGPTLFVSDNVENVCKYLLMKANLDKNTLSGIESKIDKNRKILKNLIQMKNDYEDKIECYKDCDKIMTDMRFPPEVIELHNKIEKTQSEILSLSLDNIYKPNTRSHYKKWCLEPELTYEDSDIFSSSLSDEDIKEIIELYNIKTLYKLMMMMGIGVFSNSIMKETENKTVQEDNNKYIETMKGLAEQKSLYLIIANSDYIYGTNYQFSHCYLSKDMKNLTQEKIIQCIGRIGRQEKNKHFSFRFRTQEHIDTFYSVVEDSIEVDNMNRLFGFI
jgi:hypothetical protein